MAAIAAAAALCNGGPALAALCWSLPPAWLDEGRPAALLLCGGPPGAGRAAPPAPWSPHSSPPPLVGGGAAGALRGRMLAEEEAVSRREPERSGSVSFPSACRGRSKQQKCAGRWDFWAFALVYLVLPVFPVCAFAGVYYHRVTRRRAKCYGDLDDGPYSMVAHGEFHFGLLECCTEPGMCWLGCWCAPVRAADTLAAMELGGFWHTMLAWVLSTFSGWSLDFLYMWGNSMDWGFPDIYGRFWFSTLLFATFIHTNRQKIRARFGWHGDPGCPGDFCVWWCCPCCATIQEARQVDAGTMVELNCHSGMIGLDRMVRRDATQLVGAPVGLVTAGVPGQVVMGLPAEGLLNVQGGGAADAKAREAHQGTPSSKVTSTEADEGLLFAQGTGAADARAGEAHQGAPSSKVASTEGLLFVQGGGAADARAREAHQGTPSSKVASTEADEGRLFVQGGGAADARAREAHQGTPSSKVASTEADEAGSAGSRRSSSRADGSEGTGGSIPEAELLQLGRALPEGGADVRIQSDLQSSGAPAALQAKQVQFSEGPPAGGSTDAWRQDAASQQSSADVWQQVESRPSSAPHAEQASEAALRIQSAWRGKLGREEAAQEAAGRPGRREPAQEAAGVLMPGSSFLEEPAQPRPPGTSFLQAWKPPSTRASVGGHEGAGHGGSRRPSGASGTSCRPPTEPWSPSARVGQPTSRRSSGNSGASGASSRPPTEPWSPAPREGVPLMQATDDSREEEEECAADNSADSAAEIVLGGQRGRDRLQSAGSAARADDSGSRARLGPAAA